MNERINLQAHSKAKTEIIDGTVAYGKLKSELKSEHFDVFIYLSLRKKDLKVWVSFAMRYKPVCRARWVDSRSIFCFTHLSFIYAEYDSQYSNFNTVLSKYTNWSS